MQIVRVSLSRQLLTAKMKQLVSSTQLLSVGLPVGQSVGNSVEKKSVGLTVSKYEGRSEGRSADDVPVGVGTLEGIGDGVSGSFV